MRPTFPKDLREPTCPSGGTSSRGQKAAGAPEGRPRRWRQDGALWALEPTELVSAPLPRLAVGPEINAGERGSIPAEGGRCRPQLQALRGMPRPPGPSCCLSLVFSLADGWRHRPLRGRRGCPETQPALGWDKGQRTRWPPCGEGAWGSGAGLGEGGTARMNLQASSIPGPSRASAPCPFSHPTLEHPRVSMGFRVENMDPSALPRTWLGVAGPRFQGPDYPCPIQPAEPAASDGPASVTRRPRSAFAATWAPMTANMPITPTGCAPGPPRPAKGALCLPPEASGGLAPKALLPENSFPGSPSFPERPQTQPWTVPGLLATAPSHKHPHTGGGAWDTQKILQPVPWAVSPLF